MSGNNLRAAGTRLHLFDLTATTIQVTVDGAHVIFRRHHFNSHDRLQQNRLGLFNGILKSQRAGNMKRALVRVDFMKTTINQTHSDVDHVIAGQIATLHSVVNALLGLSLQAIAEGIRSRDKRDHCGQGIDQGDPGGDR